MRKIILLVIFMFSFSLYSQLCWEESGAPLFENANLFWDKSTISLADGNFLIVWSDGESGWQRLKAMKIDSEGENLWDNPAYLKEGVSYYPQAIQVLELESGIAVAWLETIDSLSVCCQILDFNGNRLWEGNGYVQNIYQMFPSFDRITLTSAGNDNFFLSWYGTSYPREVYSVAFNINGDILEGWSAEGNYLSSSTAEYGVSIGSDGYGGLLITNFDYNEIQMQRISISGEQLWGEYGIINNFDWNWGVYNVIPDDGGYYVYYSDGEAVYDNFCSESGEFLYDEPQLFYTLSNSASSINLCRNSDGCVFITWREEDTIKLQKVTEAGAVWGEEAVTIVEFIEPQYWGRCFADDSGGSHFLGMVMNSTPREFWYQHIDAEGNTLIANEGYWCDLCISGNGAFTLCLSDNGENGLFWNEYYDGKVNHKMQMISEESGIMLEDEGRELFNLPHQHVSYTNFVSSEDYSAFVWINIIETPREIYAQILDDETGEQLFPDSFMTVCEIEGLEYRIEKAAFDEANNLLYIAFKVYTENFEFVNCGIQAVDMEGNRLFGESGLMLHEQNEALEFDHTIFRETEGGMLLLYSEADLEFEEERAWKLIKLDENGFSWNEPVTLCGSVGHYASICWSNAYLVWEYGLSLRILKFDDNGNIDPAWDNSYIVQSSPETIQGLKTFSDMQDNLKIMWIAHEYPTDWVYGQKVSPEGEFLWEEEGRFFLETTGFIRDIKPCSEFAYICDYTGSPSNDYLYKFDYDANPMWEEPLALCESDEDMDRLLICNDNLFVFYGQDYNTDIYLRGYDADGEILETTPFPGIVICDEFGGKTIFSNYINDDSELYLAWSDYRAVISNSTSRSSYYAQKIDLHVLGNSGGEIIPAARIVNYPNPFFNETRFKLLEGMPRQDAVLNIYNIKGQHIKTIKLSDKDATWNGKDEAGKSMSTAVYLYQLKSDDYQASGKMLYLGENR